MRDVASAVRPLPDDWVVPWWLERHRTGTDAEGATRTWTTVGALPPGNVGIVDPGGLVAPGRGRWSLDWWIGAEDRWHLPSREAGVRQRLVDASPVVETAMRVPGGDAVHRAYAVRASSRHGGGALLVVEIENRSAVPFAVALAVRPFDPTCASGRARVERILLVDDGVVIVDGRPGVLLGKAPARAAGSTLAAGDSAATVLAGAAAETSVDVACRDGLAQAAFLFPLAHRATMRVALPLDDGTIGFPSAAPSAAQVAEGWAAQSRRGLRLDLPDPRLFEAWQASRRLLLLLGSAASPDGRSNAPALDRLGFHREAAERLRTEPVGDTLLAALAEHWRLTRDRELVRALVPRVASLVGSRRWVRRASRAALLDAAQVLAVVDEPIAAADARRAAERASEGDSVTRRVALGTNRATESIPRLERLLDTASPTWTWPVPPGATEGHHAMAAAELCDLVRTTVLAEGDDGLALCPAVPPSWRGQPIEVGDASTGFGRLSFAVRWHGDRPAVLWELTPHAEVTEPVILTAPGLDPSWRTTDLSGEALLETSP